jgi:hypothetical protein
LGKFDFTSAKKIWAGVIECWISGVTGSFIRFDPIHGDLRCLPTVNPLLQLLSVLSRIAAVVETNVKLGHSKEERWF